MLPQLSLKARIFSGFAIILALIATNGVVSYLGSARLRTEVDRIQQTESVSAAVLRVDRDVQALRLRIDRYVTTGYDSQRDEAKDIYTRLKELIETTKVELAAEELSLGFDQISNHLEEYMNQFNSVVEERRIRRELFQDQLPAKSQDVERLFSEIAERLAQQDRAEAKSLAISQAHQSFYQAEKSFLRYFRTPDSAYVSQAVSHLQTAEEKVESAELAEQDRQTLLDEVQSYERLGLRAVQATRSYLFFLNVVMAGEASEVSYYSNQLRERTEKKREAIASRVTATSQNTNRVTAIAVALASALSFLIAARLAFLIVPPITALTQTFKKLSAGETVSKVPATDREDEIGDMAEAARAFSDQNARTRDLLTQSNALSQELQAKATELQSSVEQLDSFAYIASHDLKSPLRGIRQLSTWIEEDSEEQLSKDSRKHLALLRSRIAKMEQLLDDLLEYSRVGRLQAKAEKVDLEDVMAHIVELTDNPKQVEIVWAEDLPCLTTLRAPFEQVLLNLIGNSIKHNHRDSQGLVEIDWSLDGDQYRFSVADNGPGIDEKHHQRVFQMYQRVGDGTVEGSGMGLAIAKKQIESLGGEITLESKSGEGAKFEFTWPVSLPNAREVEHV